MLNYRCNDHYGLCSMTIILNVWLFVCFSACPDTRLSCLLTSVGLSSVCSLQGALVSVQVKLIFINATGESDNHSSD